LTNRPRISKGPHGHRRPRLGRVILDALGHPRRPVVSMPNAALAAGLRADAARLRVQKKDSGLTLSRLAGDLIGRDLSLDTRACGSAIGLTPRSLDAETVATVAACR